METKEKTKVKKSKKVTKKNKITREQLAVEMNEASYKDNLFIQVCLKNLKYFLSIWFIIPFKIIEISKNLENDLFKKFDNFIPFVSKRIHWNGNIFLKINFKNINEKNFHNIWNITIYNWFLELSKIEEIIVEDENDYNSLIDNSNFSNLYLPREIIKFEKIELDTISFNNSENNIENLEIEKIRDDYNNKNSYLWWVQTLKLLFNDRIYNNFIFNKENEDLKYLNSYLNWYENFSLLNIYIFNFIKENKNNFNTGKELLEKLKLKIKDYISELKNNNKLTEEELNELRWIYRWFENFIKKEITLNGFLDIIDEEKFLGLKIFLILNKYPNIEDLKIFYINWLKLFHNEWIKTLCSFIYWEIFTYTPLYTHFKDENKEIRLKFNIFSEFEKDIYENTLSKNKINDNYYCRINGEDYIITHNELYWDKKENIFSENILTIDKNKTNEELWINKLSSDLDDKNFQINKLSSDLDDKNFQINNLIEKLNKIKEIIKIWG